MRKVGFISLCLAVAAIGFFSGCQQDNANRSKSQSPSPLSPEANGDLGDAGTATCDSIHCLEHHCVYSMNGDSCGMGAMPCGEMHDGNGMGEGGMHGGGGMGGDGMHGGGGMGGGGMHGEGGMGGGGMHDGSAGCGCGTGDPHCAPDSSGGEPDSTGGSPGEPGGGHGGHHGVRS